MLLPEIWVFPSLHFACFCLLLSFSGRPSPTWWLRRSPEVVSHILSSSQPNQRDPLTFLHGSPKKIPAWVTRLLQNQSQRVGEGEILGGGLSHGPVPRCGAQGMGSKGASGLP